MPAALHPDLQTPVPRPARRVEGRRTDLRPLVVALLFGCIWLVVLLGAISYRSLLSQGQTVQALVVGSSMWKGKRSLHYELFYQMRPGGDIHTLSVGREAFQALPKGARFPVKVWRVGDETGIPLIRGKPHGRGEDPTFMLVVLTLIVWGCLYELIVKPRLWRALVREGDATVGQIVRIGKSKSQWVVTCEWLDDQNSPRTTQAGVDVEPDLEVGEAVSILFFPRGFRFAAVYEAMPYEVGIDADTQGASHGAPDVFTPPFRISDAPLQAPPVETTTPRRVRLRSKNPLAATVGGVGIVFYFGWILLRSGFDARTMWTHGRDFPATIQSKTLDKSGCVVRYEWQAGTRTFNGQRDFDPDECAGLQAGQSITVRALIGKSGFPQSERIVAPPLDSRFEPDADIPVGAALLLLVGMVVAFASWKSARRFWLLRTGVALPARVLGFSRDARSHDFLFRLAWTGDDSVARVADFRVAALRAPVEWTRTAPGQVTLIQSRSNPKHVEILENCEWEPRD